MTMVKVSVVIPVYNGEAHLRQCLDSVCAQTLEGVEIICVDDGSTDASWKILEEYRDKDSRFRLIRQENQHVAAARNNGLAQAQGEYVIFWDCDDFFEPRALELLCRQAEEADADICVCKNDLYNQETGKRYPNPASLNLKRIPEGETFNRFTNPKQILSFTNVYVWNKLFRRSFLVENNLTFPDFRMSEDRAFTFVALCSASKIITVNRVLIHYRWNNPESQMGKRPGDSIEDLRALEFSVESLRQRDIVPEGLGKKTVGSVIESLRWTNTEADFMAALQYLREHGLWEKFDIREREPEYYYSARHHEYVKHLLHDEPGDILAFFMHEIWQELRVVAADRRRINEELKTVCQELKTANQELKTANQELKTVNQELKTARQELKQITKQLEAQKKQLRALKNSRSYRLSRILLYPPRKIREFFQRIAHRTDA